MEPKTRGIFDAFLKQRVTVITETGEVYGILKGVSRIWLLIGDGSRYFLVKDWTWIERAKK